MRKVIDEQMMLGEVDISRIEIDPRARDEMPKLLKGLQYIYCNKELCREVFSLLEKHIGCSTTGRRGMDLWKVLVLGSVRLVNNWNYDKLKDTVDNHLTLRQMLGHTPYIDCTRYPMQTLKDNAGLITPELMNEINTLVVNAGHFLFKKKMKS